jgi:hypothetical protein
MSLSVTSLALLILVRALIVGVGRIADRVGNLRHALERIVGVIAVERAEMAVGDVNALPDEKYRRLVEASSPAWL